MRKTLSVPAVAVLLGASSLRAPADEGAWLAGAAAPGPIEK